MRGTINIGEKSIDMVANGRTPQLYNRLFHRNLWDEIQKNTKSINNDVFSELGFIMAMQAQKTGAELLNSINLEDFDNWLEQFEALDLLAHAPEILALYQGQAFPTSEPKKKK